MGQTNSYSGLFAEVYDKFWPPFGAACAPMLLNYYACTTQAHDGLPVLDLCCGTGHASAVFLKAGFPVTGIDLSEDMLKIARGKFTDEIASGQAQFICSNATDFVLDMKFGAVISTYDAFNHLGTLEAVARAFGCARNALVTGGTLLFDLNTKVGLSSLNAVNLVERNDEVILTRAIYDPAEHRCLMRISGFVHESGGIYRRFEQMLQNAAFDLQEIHQALLTSGFRDVCFTHSEDLYARIEHPEREPRVFVIAIAA